ncbi:hypothetical protein H2199_002714 [Coniosporium tulheliwenetii]|uniref:Uncharacterized protein n=1 Tax=Coniosporium tulheliwenetii TaxID=3383036 RepID=A0ACC2ZDN0_9PEZI|nr:hypothetical protein H2199_002714 [Cladosporium sp. JES 115]
MSAPNDIILFHYPFSPYARRITWYFTLRGIEYAQCVQSPVLPRPDLEALNVSYRRIPVLSIGRDIYCDTRLILRKLEERFPDGRLGATSGEQKAMERLLERWTVDAGVFWRAASLLPSNLPILNDPKFTKDRESFTGRSWDKKDMDRARPESVVHIRDAFELLETTLLADGRDWVLKTEKPTLGDIEAIWPFDWLVELQALPPNVISEKQFPKVFAWINRFREALKSARASAPKPVTLKGPEAVNFINNAEFAEQAGRVDENDPLGLKPGAQVQVWPIDSGFSHKDQGQLVTLVPDEVTISKKTKEGKEIHLHAPRWGFRIVEATDGSSRL